MTAQLRIYYGGVKGVMGMTVLETTVETAIVPLPKPAIAAAELVASRNAAVAYLGGLTSAASRRRMTNALRTVAMAEAISLLS